MTDKKNNDSNLLKKLIPYLKPHIAKLLISFFAMIIITLLLIAKPVIIGKTIDTFINGTGNIYETADSSSGNGITVRNINLIPQKKTEQTKTYARLYKSCLITGLTSEQAMTDEKNITITGGNCQIGGKTADFITLNKDEIMKLRADDLKGIVMYAMFFLLILIGVYIMSSVQGRLIQKTGQSIIFSIRNDIFKHVTGLDMRYFDRTATGSIVTRITNDTETLNQMFTDVIVNLTKNIFIIIGVITVMFVINPSVTVRCLAVLPFVIGVIILFRRLTRDNQRKIRTLISGLNSFLSEHIGGMRIIQIFSIEEKILKLFKTLNKNILKANVREMLLLGIFRPSMFFSYTVALSILLLAGSRMVSGGEITIGTIVIFMQLLNMLFDPLIELSEQFSILQSSLSATEKIFSVLDMNALITNREGAVRSGTFKGKIEFKNVWFAYEKDNWILKDISFTINPGEKIAIAGPTGSGKSTIINILSRYYDIQKGQILIDGRDIKDYHTDLIRRQIGLVMQDVFLFTGTIAENISLGNRAITADIVKSASDFVNADLFINRKPGGYGHIIGERGATFSAGERQLISFARTIAYDPSIIVLDEATANIDTETEALIQDALHKIMDKKTSIIIAHRLSTIQNCTRILVLKHGEIRESGSHEELLNKGGLYSDLYKLQYSTPQ